jgi:polysaccharide biosynthesis PFTS motif protein
MKNKINRAIFENAFDKLLNEFEAPLENKVNPILSYSKKSIINRLLQKCNELERFNFLRECSKQDPSLTLNREIIKFKRFTYNTITKDLSIKKYYIALSFIKFFIQWVSVLFIGIKTIFKFSVNRDIKKTTILYGTSHNNLFINESDEEFCKFCHIGNITPLKKAELIIVQYDNDDESCCRNIEYRKNPLHALLFRDGMSIFEFKDFLMNHFKAGYLYTKLVFISPILLILDIDFSYYALVNTLNKKLAIDNIVTTLSNYNSQPLWMNNLRSKSFNLHMLWYAKTENFFPVFKWDKIKIQIKYFQYIEVDESWVWTKSFSDYLKEIGVPGKTHVVGPILWHLPNYKTFNITPKLAKEVNICIFDRTPRNQDKIEKSGQSNFYQAISFDNMSQFINDIVHITKTFEKLTGKKVNLLLKQRNGKLSGDDIRYVDLIEHLSKDIITLLDFNSNMYNLINSTDLIIVWPYSSPAYIADYLKVPAIYFDPTQEVVPVYDKTKYIDFASGIGELEKKINKILL